MTQMQETPSVDFRSVAMTALGASRAALMDLLSAAALDRARPADIARELGIDKMLAWRISRFVGDADPFDAARFLPGSPGVEILVKAALAHGATVDQAEAARAADRTLRAFMKRHAGDRASFEAMLSANTPDDHVELEHRRAYFKYGAGIWGVRARLQMLTLILRPSEEEDGRLDVIPLTGLFDLERLRDDVPWIVRRLRAANDSESERLQGRREPLDAHGAVEGSTLPLMPDFCSTPLPRLRQFTAANGWVYDELAPGSVGKHGAVTCVTGEIDRAVIPWRRAEENTAGRYTLSVRTPVEAVLFDLLLHEDLAHFGPAELRVFGQLEDRPHAGGAAPNAVAMYDAQAARALGTPPALHTSRFRAHAALVETALGRAGWDGIDAFRGYRTEMEYPPYPCDLTMICEIGAAAGG